MGVFGLVGGALLIALNLSAVIDLVRNHAGPVFSIMMLILGVMSIHYWHDRMRLIKALQICQQGFNAFNKTMIHFDAVLKEGRSKFAMDKKTNEPQPTAAASPSVDR